MKIIEVFFSNPPEVFIARHVMALRENGIEPILVVLDEKSGSTRKSASILAENWDLGKVFIPIPSRNPIQKYASLRHLLQPHTRINGRIRDKVFSSFLES